MNEDDKLGDEHPEWNKGPGEELFSAGSGPIIWLFIALVVMIAALLGFLFEPVRNFYLALFIFLGVCSAEYAGLMGFFALNRHLHDKAPWAY